MSEWLQAPYDEEQICGIVISSLNLSPQFIMPQFPERAALHEKLSEDSALKSEARELISCLADDYCTLFGIMWTTPAADRYAEFQVQWLQHIRKVAELGLTIAFSDRQEELEAELITPAAHHVAGIAIGVFSDAPCSSETIFAFCCVITRQVFMYQQSRVLSRKEIELGNHLVKVQMKRVLIWKKVRRHCINFVVLSYIECSKSAIKSAKRVQRKIKSNVRSSSWNIHE